MLRNRRQKYIVSKQILFDKRPGRYGGWTARWSRAFGHLPLPFRKRGRVKVAGVVQGLRAKGGDKKNEEEGVYLPNYFRSWKVTLPSAIKILVTDCVRGGR